MNHPTEQHTKKFRGRLLDARLHLLDRQILDADGDPVGTVDDVEFDSFESGAEIAPGTPAPRASALAERSCAGHPHRRRPPTDVAAAVHPLAVGAACGHRRRARLHRHVFRRAVGGAMAARPHHRAHPRRPPCSSVRSSGCRYATRQPPRGHGGGCPADHIRRSVRTTRAAAPAGTADQSRTRSSYLGYERTDADHPRMLAALLRWRHRARSSRTGTISSGSDPTRSPCALITPAILRRSPTPTNGTADDDPTPVSPL